MSEGLSFGGARARGVAVVCAGLGLIAWSVGLGFRHVLPTLAPDRSESLPSQGVGVRVDAVGARAIGRYGAAWWGHFGAFLLLFLQFACSYVAAIRTDPGTHGSPELQTLLAEARARGLLPEPAGKEGKEEGGEGGGDVLRPADRGGWLLHAAAPYAWRRCPHSGQPKPPRAHYCRHSQRLVLEMDHHCVWIFNTVGWGNYGSFYRAVLWFVVGSAFGCAEAHAAYGTLRGRQQEGVRELWLLRFVLLAALAVVVPFLGPPDAPALPAHPSPCRLRPAACAAQAGTPT